MAWIESHQNLRNHPKVYHLSGLLGVPLDVTVGRLHFLWWWCLDYALDGNLAGKESIIQSVCEIPFDKLVEAGFIEPTPYPRIHDWWDYAGRFIRLKYKNYPEKITRIERELLGTPKNTPKGTPKTTNQPTLNQPKEKKKEAPLSIPDDLKPSEPEIRDWIAYKQESGFRYKPVGLKALFGRFRSIPPEKRRASVDNAMACGWKGLFEVDEKKGEQNGNQYPHE
jgi:hypothetical protein